MNTDESPQQRTSSKNDALLQPRVCPSGRRDGRIHGPDRTASLHMAPQTLRLHIGKSDNREDAVWNEGEIFEACRRNIIADSDFFSQITFIFILILFIDSVNRVYRVQVELSASKETQGG